MAKSTAKFACSKVKIMACLAVSVFVGTSTHAGSVPALYTAQQATDGKTVFSQNCAICHGHALQGKIGPALVGQNFAPASGNNTVGSIFTMLSTQMPYGAGGSLTQTQYEDAMSYILSKNGYPAGRTMLGYSSALASTVPLVSQVK